MADKDEAPKGAPASKSTAVSVRLGESPNGQPLLVNYSAATVASGLVLIDFGFLEPAMLAALSRAARSGGKVPASVNGKLSARVAIPPDAARALYAQLGRLLTRPAAKAGRGSDPTVN